MGHCMHGRDSMDMTAYTCTGVHYLLGVGHDVVCRFRIIVALGEPLSDGVTVYTTHMPLLECTVALRPTYQ